jgi:stage II sporulation protein M
MSIDRETLFFTLISITIFSIGILLGIQHSQNIMEIAKIVYNIDGIGGNDGSVEINKLSMFLLIFSRNTLVTALNVSLGPIFGLFPVFTLLFNGYLIGGILAEVSASYGLTYTLMGIVPHGIFEIPAFIYSTVLGLKLARLAIKTSFKGEQLSETYINYLWRIVRVIIPLLFIAALIEAYVTTALLNI